MARQGVHKWERSMCGLTFYRLYDKWYIRRNSSLTGRRVKTSKKFANSRVAASYFGKGSGLAANVYRVLPESWKMFELYQRLTAMAAAMLREEKTDAVITAALEQQLYDWGYRKEITYPTIQRSTARFQRNRKVPEPAVQQEEKASPQTNKKIDKVFFQLRIPVFASYHLPCKAVSRNTVKRRVEYVHDPPG
ncbi:MAG: hypothetical protein QM731_19535 [Chitinophagaceae bacterium]